jgi:cytochrome P450
MTATGTRRTAPGLRQHFPLPYGILARMQREPLRFYLDARARFGDVFRYQVGRFVFHLLSHPDHVKHVLQDDNKNYPKSRFYDLVRLVTGEGLVVSEGDYWRRQRRLMQPAFQRQRLAALGTMMTETAAALVERWPPHAASGQPLDIFPEMMHLTLTVVARALFSTDLSSAVEAVGRSLTAILEFINFRMNHPFALPLRFPTPRNLRYRREIRTLDQVVYGILAERRREGKDRGDLLSLLMLARDEETGEGMTDQQLRDEMMTFLLAGHETTAITLSWTWYLLSRHPDVDRRLRAELAEVLGGRLPTVPDLPNLKYMRMVIEEALRLYPPVWALSRGVVADDAVGGYHIPAGSGSFVVLSPYVTHRHPAFWENPEGFDPERFTPEHSAGRPRYAYFPFLGGPRQCIGNDFALMEAQLVVATVAQAYRLHLAPGYTVEPDPIFTLRPRPGVLMTVHGANHDPHR